MNIKQSDVTPHHAGIAVMQLTGKCFCSGCFLINLALQVVTIDDKPIDEEQLLSLPSSEFKKIMDLIAAEMLIFKSNLK